MYEQCSTQYYSIRTVANYNSSEAGNATSKKNDPVETNRCFSAAVRDNKTKTVQRKFPG